MDRVTILDDGYGQAKYSSGYTAASNYYRANRRQYAWSGTVTFNRDFTFGTDQFGIFIYGKDFSGNPVTELVDEGYQSVNGRVISPGDSWSAGTYPYIGMFEEVSIRGTRPIKDGYLEEPIFFHQGDGSFNVKLFFLQ